MKTLEQLRSAVENKSARILSTGLANDLKGRRIATIYFGHHGQDGINEFVVGDVVSHFELALRDTSFNSIDPRYANRAEYWESYMTPTQLATMKNKLMLLTADGVETQINCYENEGAFWCSDSDRFVYFIEVE